MKKGLTKVLWKRLKELKKNNQNVVKYNTGTRPRGFSSFPSKRGILNRRLR